MKGKDLGLLAAVAIGGYLLYKYLSGSGASFWGGGGDHTTTSTTPTTWVLNPAKQNQLYTYNNRYGSQYQMNTYAFLSTAGGSTKVTAKGLSIVMKPLVTYSSTGVGKLSGPGRNMQTYINAITKNRLAAVTSTSIAANPYANKPGGM